MPSNAERYRQSMLAAIEDDLGGPLPAGTTLVAAEARAGSGIATCYPFDGRSAIWCDPEVDQQLTPLVGATVLGARDFVARAVELGATVRGVGLNRVLDRPPIDPQIALGGCSIRALDRDVTADVALIADLRAAVSDDDAEEADLDLANLDPHIVAAVAPRDDDRVEHILAFASSRPGESVPFDDIGVITHPDARRRGLGVACVHRLIASRQASGVPAMYRCEAANTGSDRIARRLGFDLVQTIGSVRFGA